MNLNNNVLAMVVSFTLCACGSSDDKSPPSEVTPPIESDIVSITVTSSATLTSDQRRYQLPVDFPAKFTATAHYKDGSTETLSDSDVIWSTNDAVFDIDAVGVIWAQSISDSDIRVAATFGDLSSDSAILRVIDTAPSSGLKVDGPSKILLNIPALYTSSLSFENDLVLDLSYFTEWSVDVSTALIDSHGVLTAEVEGALIVSGAYENDTQDMSVAVYDLDTVSLSVSSPIGSIIPVNVATQFTAMAMLQNENIDVTDSVEWDYSACNGTVLEDDNKKGLLTFSALAECEVFAYLSSIDASIALTSGTIDAQALDFSCYDSSGTSTTFLWAPLDCKTKLTTEFTTINGVQPPLEVDVTTLSQFNTDDTSVIYFATTPHGTVVRQENGTFPGDSAVATATYENITKILNLSIGFPGDSISIVSNESEIIQGGEVQLIAESEGVNVSSSVEWEIDAADFTISATGLLTVKPEASVGDTVRVTATMPEVFGISSDDILITVKALEECDQGDLSSVQSCLEIVTAAGMSFTSPPKVELSLLLDVHNNRDDDNGFSYYDLNRSMEWCEKLNQIAWHDLTWQLASPSQIESIDYNDVSHWPANVTRTSTLQGMVFWSDNGANQNTAIVKRSDSSILQEEVDVDLSVYLYATCVGE